MAGGGGTPNEASGLKSAARPCLAASESVPPPAPTDTTGESGAVALAPFPRPFRSVPGAPACPLLVPAAWLGGPGRAWPVAALGHVQQVGDGGLHGRGARGAEVHVDHVVRAGGADEGQGTAALSLQEVAPSSAPVAWLQRAGCGQRAPAAARCCVLAPRHLAATGEPRPWKPRWGPCWSWTARRQSCEGHGALVHLGECREDTTNPPGIGKVALSPLGAPDRLPSFTPEGNPQASRIRLKPHGAEPWGNSSHTAERGVAPCAGVP